MTMAEFPKCVKKLGGATEVPINFNDKPLLLSKGRCQTQKIAVSNINGL
jgi:hypothetical protein